MNAYLSIVLTAAIIASGPDDTQSFEENAMTMKQLAFDQCFQENPITKEAVESIVSLEHMPDEYKVKIEEGKINWERFKNLTKHFLKKEEDKAKIDKITEICQAEVPKQEEDECQLAYSAVVCKFKNWKKFGLPRGIN